MALIDEIKTICDRLAPLGWRDLLLSVTGNVLDISQTTTTKLKAVLTSDLSSVDRLKLGFQDFHPTGRKAIDAGRPARSLLFHALASPDIHPTADGLPSVDPQSYATLEELDVLENFIYSLAADRTDLAGTVVAVFAYQYRTANRTSHRRYADVAYSRTGGARVGTAAPLYDPSRRSFWVVPPGGGDDIAVLPARYGTYLARRAKPGVGGTVQGGHKGVNDADYLFPVHKLFPGSECLKGRTLDVQFFEFHRSEKLAKTHLLSESEGGLPVPAGFDITKPPYVRDSANGNPLVSLKTAGTSVLVVPNPAKTLVRAVSQENSVTNTPQLVHFVVPQKKVVRGRITRFADSSLEIPAFKDRLSEDSFARLAPEYVNIRHKVDPAGPVTQPLTDQNALSTTEFTKAMAEGGYPAAHFVDDSCDGCVESVVTGLAGATDSFPAFSLVTAPDFFPLADQLEVDTDPTIEGVEPLSIGRLPVNPTLPLPSRQSTFAFPREFTTVTAIVGGMATGPEVTIPGRVNRMVSFLPDAASNIFAPGWDTSQSRDALGAYLTSSGLGSPFPEDAKLCAALSSFWPAVAPDNARTFGNENWPNQLPMLDEELGLHPSHERVTSGQATSFRGWDGEFGPFFEAVEGKQHVNYVPIERSDYVSHALAGRIRVSLTAEVQGGELIARHQVLAKCVSVLASFAANDKLCLVVFRKVADWAAFGRGAPQLKGGGFLLEFAELTGARKATADLGRVRRQVQKRFVCQFGENGIAFQNDTADFVFIQ